VTTLNVIVYKVINYLSKRN